MLHTEIIHLLNNPSFDPRSVRGSMPRNQQMGAVVSFHHGDDGVAIQRGAKGTTTWHAIILIADTFRFLICRSRFVLFLFLNGG